MLLANLGARASGPRAGETPAHPAWAQRRLPAGFWNASGGNLQSNI